MLLSRSVSISSSSFRYRSSILEQLLSPLGRTPIFSLPSRIKEACGLHCSFCTDSWVPTLAVFSLCPSRPSDPRASAHLLADSCTVSLSPVAGCDRVTVSRSKHALQTSSFVPILGFGSCVSPTLVGFFSPDCDFLVVIVLVASLSCATSRLVCSSSSILW